MALQYIYPPSGDFSDENGNPAIRLESETRADELRRLPVSVIVAAGENGEIGIRGEMIWHLREDLKRFKRITSGCPVIMGRRTWESLPKRPLPDRRNIIVSRNPAFSAPGAETALSLPEAIASCAGAREIFIIGGGEIYRQSLPFASTIHLTRVLASCPEADTYFPMPDENIWRLTDVETEGVTPEGIRYRFETYRRI